MNKIFCIVCLICIFSCAAISAPVNVAKISGIEKQLFGYEYKNDSEINRVNRIENYLYGKNYPNSITVRLDKISKDIGYIDKIAAKDKPNSFKNEKIASSSQSNIKDEPEDPSVRYPIVDKMESKMFNRIYDGESIYKRVDRLEKKAFGKNLDDNLSNRVNQLRLAIIDPNRADDFITGAAIPTENYYDSISSLYDDDVKRADSGLNKLSKDDDYEYSSPSISRNNAVNLELSTIEQKMFNQSYSREKIEQRLSRIEINIFKRDFQKDNPSTRLQRIAAVNTAQKTAKMYDNNKTMRNLSTGVQVGSILLLILAMIL